MDCFQGLLLFFIVNLNTFPKKLGQNFQESMLTGIKVIWIQKQIFFCKRRDRQKNWQQARYFFPWTSLLFLYKHNLNNTKNNKIIKLLHTTTMLVVCYLFGNYKNEREMWQLRVQEGWGLVGVGSAVCSERVGLPLTPSDLCWSGRSSWWTALLPCVLCRTAWPLQHASMLPHYVHCTERAWPSFTSNYSTLLSERTFSSPLHFLLI